jgi:hypothetical protein
MKRSHRQKITELEVICKRLREDAQRLREERTTLKGMIQSHDELILEMAEEYGLNTMTPLAPAPAAVPEEIIEEEDPVENAPQELDDLDDLGDLDEGPNEGCSDVDEWFSQDGSNDRD